MKKYSISRTQKTLKDIEWGSVIQGKVCIADNINTHSLVWN